jgi:hypothetical protein
MSERREKTTWQLDIENRIDQNTALTEEVKGKVDEVHETLITIKGALKVFEWIATALKHVTWILGAIGAAIGLYKFGVDGTPPKIDLPK